MIYIVLKDYSSAGAYSVIDSVFPTRAGAEEYVSACEAETRGVGRSFSFVWYSIQEWDFYEDASSRIQRERERREYEEYLELHKKYGKKNEAVASENSQESDKLASLTKRISDAISRNAKRTY